MRAFEKPFIFLFSGAIWERQLVRNFLLNFVITNFNSFEDLLITLRYGFVHAKKNTLLIANTEFEVNKTTH